MDGCNIHGDIILFWDEKHIEVFISSLNTDISAKRVLVYYIHARCHIQKQRLFLMQVEPAGPWAEVAQIDKNIYTLFGCLELGCLSSSS